MYFVNQNAQRVLERLTRDLDIGAARKLDNGGAGVMAVHVNRLTTHTYSVTHYYTRNGDRMADPDMVFWRGDDGRFLPVSFQQDSLGLYQQAVYFGADGKPESFQKRLCRQLATFAGTWMRNILQQQKLGRERAG